MDANYKKLINIRISKTLENLKKNNFNAVFVPEKSQALSLLKTILIPKETIAVGGSVTLNEIGALDLIKNGDYNFIDKFENNLSPEEKKERARQSLLADTFITSTNAITENGYLYNVDATGNRAAAFVFGPKRVIVFAGYNKIVPDMASAVVRVKKIACPANTIRLDCDTFCEKEGHCVKDYCDARELMSIPAGICKNTICTSFVASGYQRDSGRITVVIIGEELGY